MSMTCEQAIRPGGVPYLLNSDDPGDDRPLTAPLLTAPMPFLYPHSERAPVGHRSSPPGN